MKKYNSILKDDSTVLQLVKVTKKFPGVLALDDVSFDVKKGKLFCLVGENGAGKSTLLKIISGVIPHNKFGGKVLFNGKETRFSSIKDSENLGISIIHQELAISPHLTLYENIFVGDYIGKMGILNWNAMIKKAKYYLNLVGLKKNPSEIAGNLSIAEQQLLEIAKALAKKTKFLILDEPTSSLNDEDAFHLLDMLKKLRDENGLTCMFVSHKLNEVFYLADSITVIRDGKHIADYKNVKINHVSEKTLIKDIVGRELKNKFPPRNKNKKIKQKALEVKKLTVEHSQIRNKIVVQDSSFNVRKGEIVGISGLVGSGRTEMAKNIFGQAFGKRKEGTILINNKKVKLSSPIRAILKGLVYASEDRKNEGLFQIFSVHENINMSSLHLFSNKLGMIDKNKMIVNSLLMKQRVNIKVPNIDYNVESLSGGNQQKVLIAKALTTNFDILIVDEPTKGIDVGSKFEIYEILKRLAEEEEKAIVVISSEIEELLGITDRIFVMSQGKIKGEVLTTKATPEKIIEIAIGSKK